MVGRPKFDFHTGAASRHPWIEPRNCEPPAPGNDPGAVVAWCRAVGEALNSQQLAAHDAVKHAHHQVLRAASFFPARQARTQSIRLARRRFVSDAVDAVAFPADQAHRRASNGR